ncbi:CoA pyrophosphatase [Uliginosibacterium sp. H3]|uniref:CoA pyrophosphatase n=1 Tax=Uliginosibacterium silvisoli TaxID=3114758 RepID=A0ABU6K461_9RHOO|nr:CoA pyrophosphatase [Uliginosibacterium sp. H3]
MTQDQLLSTLHQRFARNAQFAWEEEWPLQDGQSGAGVLIALTPKPYGLSVLLTRRTDHLYNHPGQISFPGGRIEASDASPVDAALREAEEEIGLPADQVEVLGVLPDYGTSSGFRVTPVVGLTHSGFVPRLDDFEVAELFDVPLQFLLHTANYQRHRVERHGQVKHFYAVPYPGRFIWGATAGMLAMFAAFMTHPLAGLENARADGQELAGARLSERADLGATTPAAAASGVYSD